MSACLPVSIGTLNLNGATDADGIRWWWTEMPGWWDGAEVEQDWLPRTGASGTRLGSSVHGGRAVVVRGAAEMTTRPYASLYPVAADKLAAATNLVEGAGGLMVVNEAVAPKQATVWRARPPRLRPRAGMRGMDFEIPLQTEDWRKFGTTLKAIAAGTVTNAGNTYATPVVTVTGPAAGPVRVTNATDGGKYVEVNRALVAGEVLTIDMEAMTVVSSVAGILIGFVTAFSRFWDLLAGPNTVSHSGGGTLGGTFRDAYA